MTKWRISIWLPDIETHVYYTFESFALTTAYEYGHRLAKAMNGKLGSIL